jgi:acetyltransferase-like isoleucine patch superfamily enzyme
MTAGAAERWSAAAVPDNARVGPDTLISGEFAFKRFHSTLRDALVIGAGCTMDGTQFALGPQARVVIGDYCYFTNAVVLAEEEVRIGNYVVIGWNTTIADTDFHPVAPAERILDAVACSPLGRGTPRPPIRRMPVVIDDDVWIGPNATILKGVRVGAGAYVEAGSLVTSDVPPGAHVAGNPAMVEPPT